MLSLDEIVSLHVDGRRGLVQHEELCLAEEGPREANELPLPHAQVLAALVDAEVKSAGQIRDVP